MKTTITTAITSTITTTTTTTTNTTTTKTYYKKYPKQGIVDIYLALSKNHFGTTKFFLLLQILAVVGGAGWAGKTNSRITYFLKPIPNH